jgi:hypothetical protein
MFDSLTSLFIGSTAPLEPPKNRVKFTKPIQDKNPIGRPVGRPVGRPRKNLEDKSVGRPPKNPEDKKLSVKNAIDVKNMKKSVGRPRKNPVDVKNMKKSVGRPRKNPVDVNSGVKVNMKKSVGRPRKNPVNPSG